MGDSLFEESGPNHVRRAGPEWYQMSVPLPTDDRGLLGRECPREGRLFLIGLAL